MSGRREQRAEMQRTWMVLEPREAGRPMRRKDLEDAAIRAEAQEVSGGVVMPSTEIAISRNVHLPSLIRVAKTGAVMARPARPSGGKGAPVSPFPSGPLVDVWRREIAGQRASVNRIAGQRASVNRSLAVHDLTLDEDDNIVQIADGAAQVTMRE